MLQERGNEKKLKEFTSEYGGYDAHPGQSRGREVYDVDGEHDDSNKKPISEEAQAAIEKLDDGQKKALYKLS